MTVVQWCSQQTAYSQPPRDRTIRLCRLACHLQRDVCQIGLELRPCKQWTGSNMWNTALQFYRRRSQLAQSWDCASCERLCTLWQVRYDWNHDAADPSTRRDLQRLLMVPSWPSRTVYQLSHCPQFTVSENGTLTYWCTTDARKIVKCSISYRHCYRSIQHVQTPLWTGAT